MNTCGNCRYRGEPVLKHDDDYVEQLPTGYFFCSLIKHIGMVSEVPQPASGAAVADGSGYYAALCVADDFGCNRWEAANGVKGGSDAA